MEDGSLVLSSLLYWLKSLRLVILVELLAAGRLSDGDRSRQFVVFLCRFLFGLFLTSTDIGQKACLLAGTSNN